MRAKQLHERVPFPHYEHITINKPEKLTHVRTSTQVVVKAQLLNAADEVIAEVNLED